MTLTLITLSTGKAEEGEEHAGGEEEEESVMRMLDLVKNAEREKADDLQLLLSEMNTANRAKLQEAETLDPLNESVSTVADLEYAALLCLTLSFALALAGMTDCCLVCRRVGCNIPGERE